MANVERARLLGVLALLALSLIAWPAQAGSADDPEFTDAAGDPEVQGIVPIGQAGALSDGVDLRAGWVNDTATDLLLSLQVEGDIQLLDPGVEYDFEFHFTLNGTERIASAHWAGSFEAGGVATAVAAVGPVIVFTVPKADVGAFRGDTLTGLFAQSSGTLVSDPLSSVLDRAPDSGSGRDYNVTQGFARGGSPSDTDADGLPDAWETEEFGGIDAESSTGDPDQDGLDNAAENAAGTDPQDEDTDGDLLQDGEDSAPLDPDQPTDSDGDGLRDAWEREHFTTVDAQDADGDPDADTLTNEEELELGTDPNKADSDGDGAEDASDPDPLDPDVAGGSEEGGRKPRPELYAGSAFFALSATFILLGLAKGI